MTSFLPPDSVNSVDLHTTNTLNRNISKLTVTLVSINAQSIKNRSSNSKEKRILKAAGDGLVKYSSFSVNLIIR